MDRNDQAAIPLFSHNLVADETRALTSEQTIGLIAKFARHVARVPWFHNLGEPLTPDDRRLARAYSADLGFPRVSIIAIHDFEEAAIAAQTLDMNSPAFEAEEHMRADLLDRAMERIEADLFGEAMREVQAFAGDIAFAAVEDLGARFALDDEALLHAAAGAAVQASHLAALVLAAGADNHPFISKFRLFELGRWPVAIIGNSLHVF